MRLRIAAVAVALLAATAALLVVLLTSVQVVRAGARPAPPVEPAPLAEVSGRLRTVNLVSRVVTVVGADGPVRMEVVHTTSVFCHGRLGGLSDLAVGQPVRVQYTRGGARPVAVWIELLP
ncbi:MAG: hypothetical protein ACYC8T_31620 [Myxococcaceae bacterium]